MNVFHRRMLMIGLVAAGTFYVATARAQCNIELPKVELRPQSWQSDGTVRMRKVDWHDDDEAVVGMWNVTFTSKGSGGIPDGTVIDRGLQQWNPGGNEFLNSSGQHPLTQNYCLGTWTRVDRATFALNHFAYNYDANQNVVGLTRIEELVRVENGGQRFTGTFRIRAYDTARNLLQEIKGTLAAFRITIDTTAAEVH